MIIPCAILIISLFSIGTDSLNSVNFPSALSDVFLEGIRTNKDLPDIGLRTFDNEECRTTLREMVRRFPSPQVLTFFDSWGKIPSGVKHGNMYEVGNFDECVQATLEFDKVIESQYCFASIPLKNPFGNEIKLPQWSAPAENAKYSVPPIDHLHIGICIPKTCSPEMAEHVFESALDRINNTFLRNITVSRCTTGRTEPPKPINIIGICVFSMFGALMILSSIYEWSMGILQKKPIESLLAFSMLRNGKKLFAINTNPSPNKITCLDGIRVLSMIWVIYCHTYMTSYLFPANNTSYSKEWYTDVWSMHILHGTVSVDTFFFLSGLLVAWIGFRELEKLNGKPNICMMYVHRYVRLTPVVGAVLLFAFSINELLYNGPFKYISLSKNECDSSNWWPILLYISNYFRISTCFDQTWYLAVDFQLFVLSPLLLIPMRKWGKRFVPVLVLICLLSAGCVMAVYISHEFTSFITGTYPEEWKLTYIPTHTRCPPWIVGFGLGYFMYVKRNNTFKISKKLQLLGWLICFTILLGIIFGPYMINENNEASVIQAAMYEAWKRVLWGIALAWIVFVCHHGFGGIVHVFLSHPFWQPISRLTFSLYLIHMTVVRLNFGMIRSQLHYSNYELILIFWGVFGISLMAAVLLTLAFEYPIMVFEEFLLRRYKQPAKSATNQPYPQTHQTSMNSSAI